MAGRQEAKPESPEAEAIHARVDQLSVLELRDVMTPRVDVVYLTIPVTPEAIAEAVRDTGHSCFPVVVGDLDEVEGVLFVNDLFRSTAAKRAIGVSLPTASEIARKIRRPLMLPETLDLLESLKELREQRRTFAIVLDEHADRWLVDGQTHVDKVEEELGVMIPEGEYVTVAGFVLDLAGEIPSAGTTYSYGDWTFRVQSVERRRISEIVIERHPPVSDVESADS